MLDPEIHYPALFYSEEHQSEAYEVEPSVADSFLQFLLEEGYEAKKISESVILFS